MLEETYVYLVYEFYENNGLPKNLSKAINNAFEHAKQMGLSAETDLIRAHVEYFISQCIGSRIGVLSDEHFNVIKKLGMDLLRLE